MIGFDLDKLRHFTSAHVVSADKAALGKPALLGRLDRRCDLAFELDPLSPVSEFRNRDGREQRLCVGVDRFSKSSSEEPSQLSVPDT